MVMLFCNMHIGIIFLRGKDIQRTGADNHLSWGFSWENRTRNRRATSQQHRYFPFDQVHSIVACA